MLALIRIRYPFELEWIEGALVDHVRWLLTGHKLYVPPSLDFVPYFYTPLYFYLGAALSTMTGVGFVPLRLISFLSSLGCFAIIFLFVKRETASAFAGFLAMSFFAATYQIGGAWFDLARIDMLFLLFLLWSIYLIRFYETWLGYLLAGVMISLSFLTKQNALLMAVPIALYCVIVRPRLAIFFLGSAALLIGGSSLVLNRIHDGWFNYYVFKLAPHHYMLRHRIVFYWIEDLLAPLPVAGAAAIFYVYRRLADSFRKEGLFYLLTSVGILGGTWITRLHTGAFVNVLIPAYGMIAILFGLGVHRILVYIKEGIASGQTQIVANLMSVVYFICLVQFAALLYDPTHQVPKKADLEAGREFIQTISLIDGDIWVPGHGFYPALAGKKTFAHAGSIEDILRADPGPVAQRLRSEIEDAFREHKFSTLVMDKGDYKFFVSFDQYYKFQRHIFKSPDVFNTLTGQAAQPDFIYVPRTTEGAN